MTNKEKYGNEIIELAANTALFVLKNGKPALCKEIECEDWIVIVAFIFNLGNGEGLSILVLFVTLIILTLVGSDKVYTCRFHSFICFELIIGLIFCEQNYNRFFKCAISGTNFNIYLTFDDVNK